MLGNLTLLASYIWKRHLLYTNDVYLSLIRKFIVSYVSFSLSLLIMKDWHIHCHVTSNEVLGFQFEKQGHQGAVWFHFFLSLNFHYSTFITYNSSLNFSYPFGIITKFPSFNIFHTICGPIPVSRCNFFFFFFSTQTHRSY